MNGPVEVVVQGNDGVVSLEITPAGTRPAQPVRFPLAGAPLDALVGAVTAEVGAVFAGEGSEYGYVRLTDAHGVWIEGGRSTIIDDNAQGGGSIGAPFVLGADTGERCRRSGANGYDTNLHEVGVQVDGASEPQIVDAQGIDGIWRGVNVRALGVGADLGSFVEAPNTADGLGAGPHEITTVVGYLYRVLE
jgi:hypothetical protein